LLLLLARDKRKRKRCSAVRVVKKVLFIEERLLLILIASGWILLAHDREDASGVLFCVLSKSAGLDRLDLIDFNAILCIEKEGKDVKNSKVKI